MANKTIKFNEKDVLIVKILKEANAPLTLAEINAIVDSEIHEISNFEIKPGTITATKNKGVIAVAPEKKTTFRKQNREVSTYKFVTDEVMKNAKGKEKAYSDSEKEILEVLKKADGVMTLAEIAKARNLDKIGAGAISGLVKAGNVEMAGRIKVESFTEDEVNAYVFVKDIPTDAMAFGEGK